jgi:hypothetical protein
VTTLVAKWVVFIKVIEQEVKVISNTVQQLKIEKGNLGVRKVLVDSLMK